MTALPFLTAPAAPSTRDIGTPSTGTLRFPVMGGLTVHESVVIDELLSERPNTFVEAAKVADAIATGESISRVEAFTLIENAVGGQTMEPEAQSLRLKYADRINAVIHLFANSNKHTTEAAVTALIRCRLDRPTWTVSDTHTLARRLLNDIYDLYLDELEAEATPTSQLTDEELGKQPPASGSRPKRTGSKSPTTSSTTSPANTTDSPSAESCDAPPSPAGTTCSVSS